jgi:hypothetical protein
MHFACLLASIGIRSVTEWLRLPVPARAQLRWRLSPTLVVLASLVAACGGGDAPPRPDAGSRDLGTADLGDDDLGTADLGTADLGNDDLGTADLGSVDLGADGARPDLGPGGCTSDRDCPEGEQWCERGRCVPCDNTGLVCRIVCREGWTTYMRNGCSPCECAPPNQCASDVDCAAGDRCWPGLFCWCADGSRSPDCCRGNVCSGSACTMEPPLGCLKRGCPRGQECDTGAGCVSSGCSCMTSGSGSATYVCTPDCGGGRCVAPSEP